MMDKVVYEQDFLMLLSLSGLQQRRDICSLSKDLMRENRVTDRRYSVF